MEMEIGKCSQSEIKKNKIIEAHSLANHSSEFVLSSINGLPGQGSGTVQPWEQSGKQEERRGRGGEDGQDNRKH
jgi:hypothetical protein